MSVKEHFTFLHKSYIQTLNVKDLERFDVPEELYSVIDHCWLEQ